MPTLKTRNSETFDLLSDPLDRSLSPYAESYPEYLDRCAALTLLVGVDFYLWCYPENKPIAFYEGVKLVEWIINVSDDQILGYVDDDKWFQYLENGGDLPSSTFSSSQPQSDYSSILVKFPLRQNELVKKIVYRFIKPDKAEVIKVENYT